MNKYISLIIWVVLIVGFVAIQFISVEFTNPPASEMVPLSEESEIILKKACFDCHSNESEYSWFTKVAPVSFMVKRQVTEGRENLNFSHWDKYSKDKQSFLLEKMIKELKEKDMPPTLYTIMNPAAVLNEIEKESLYRWAKEVAIFIQEGSQVRQNIYETEEDESKQPL